MGLTTDIATLINLERPHWEEISRRIPAWHPRCEDPPAGGQTGGQGGSGGGSGTGTPAPPADPKAQAAVDAAYEKLRAAETERDELRKQIAAAKRDKLGDVEKLQAELQEAKDEAEKLKGAAAETTRQETIVEIAESMKFKNPKAAKRFVLADATTTKQIKAALTEAVEDIPELIASGSAPPPVNGAPGTGGSMNQQMNAQIRRAAGRGIAA